MLFISKSSLLNYSLAGCKLEIIEIFERPTVLILGGNLFHFFARQEIVMFDQFTNWISFEELHCIGFEDIPNEKGLYVVRRPQNMNVEFNPNTTAIFNFKGKSMLYDIDYLTNKYNASDKRILYIGKAGGQSNKLKQRVEQLVKYGYGLVENHRGGRAIWQINNNKFLQLSFIKNDFPEIYERKLLKAYLDTYGVLPLANWRIG